MAKGTKQPAQTFSLTLRALPERDYGPVYVRLRRVLKALLRSYGFECRNAIELPLGIEVGDPAACNGAASRIEAATRSGAEGNGPASGQNAAGAITGA